MRPSLRHQASDVEVFPDTPLMSRDTEDHDVFEEHVVKFQSALAELKTTSTGLKSGVGLTFFRRFWRLWRMGFPSWYSRMALRFYLQIVIGLGFGFCLSFIQVLVVPKLIVAVFTGDKAATGIVFAWGITLIVAVSVMGALGQYLGERLALDWRVALQRKFHNAYFSGKILYWLNQVDKSIDNCDQRMTVDLVDFTRTAAGLLFSSFETAGSMWMVLSAILTSIYTSVKLIGGASIGIAFAYFVVVMFLTLVLNSRVARSTFRVNEGEGFFRFRHARIKEFAECVTLYDGQRAERALSQSAFDVLYWRMRQLFRVSLHQNILTNVQNQLSQPLAQLIIAVTIISSHSLNGKAVTQQSSQVSLNALAGFLSSFCMVPPLYAIFGSLAGITHRVGQLMEALEELRIASVRLQSRTAVEESSAIGVTNLCCRTPDGNILFQNMSFMVSPGSSLLIMGPSGCGKSSLLRIIAGLWPVDDGIVFRPLTIGEGGIFFVPQRPYIPQGTLRAQVLYPHTEKQQRGYTDRDLERLLEEVNLGYLLSRGGGLDAVEEWADALSLGEQQRIAFARLFYHGPRYAIMDESTSALDEETEAKCLQRCLTRGISLVSVGHRPSLKAFHTHLLLLRPDATYTMTRLPPTSTMAGQASPSRRLHEPGGVGGVVSAASAAVLAGASSGGDDGRHGTADGVASEEVSPLLGMQESLLGSNGHAAAADAFADDAMLRVRTPLEAGNPWGNAVFDVDPRHISVSFDAVFFRRFWWMFRLAFRGACRKPTLVLLCAVALSGVCAGISMLSSLAQARATAGLSGADFVKGASAAKAAEMRVVVENIVLAALQGAIAAFLVWLGRVLALYWQKQLIFEMENVYFKGKTLYAANKMVPSLDNMDQRIADDSRNASQGVMQFLFGTSFLQGVVASLFAAVVFFSFTVKYGWFLTLWTLGSCSFNVLVTRVLMKRIPAAAFAWRRTEGDLRFAHARVREYSESVAFYDGQLEERHNVDDMFSKATAAFRAMLLAQLPPSLFAQVYTTMSGTVAFGGIAVSMFYLDGFKSGSYTQAFEALGMMAGMAQSIAQLAVVLGMLGPTVGIVQRVGVSLEKLADVRNTYEYFDRRACVTNGSEVGVEKLTCRTPTGEILFKNMTFNVRSGESVIIMGPSGCGKSSLLRVIAGLWPFEAGRVSRPEVIGNGGLFFVPQRPYIIEGTLREQLLYPHSASQQNCGDRELLELLRSVRLGHLVTTLADRALDDDPQYTRSCSSTAEAVALLDENKNWAEILSGGEQQRLGIARVLYHLPMFALMDESTSAMDIELEAHCMALLRSKGVTCVSVGHRPSLLPFHDYCLLLDGRGGYRFGPVHRHHTDSGDVGQADVE